MESQKDKKAEIITRKEALKKVGKYAAYTAAATITILSPKASQANSGGEEPASRGRDY